MAINYNNNNQGIGDLDLSQYGLIQPESTNMQVAGGYDTPTAGAYGFNLIELDRLKNAGYNPGEVSNWENKEDVQNLIRSLEPQASAVNESGYPLTASLSGAVPNRVSATEDIDIDSLRNPFESFQNETIEENSIPQNFRTRMNNPFFERPTLSNASSPANYFNQGLGGVKGIKEKMGQGWNFAQQLPGMAMSALSGIPGAGLLMGALGNSFEDRQLTGDGTIVDEYGRSYTADELNSQNALGGWYTDAARSSRRRNKSVQKMLDRQKKESLSRLGEKRLAKLQAQQALENANRLSATKTLAAQNKAAGTGGYQSSFGKDAGFMGGSGTSADMGSFRDGGLATLFARRG